MAGDPLLAVLNLWMGRLKTVAGGATATAAIHTVCREAGDPGKSSRDTGPPWAEGRIQRMVWVFPRHARPRPGGVLCLPSPRTRKRNLQIFIDFPAALGYLWKS